nr:immunoglobulin light chain junction region [Macaca mulatta]MOW02934.1 immunoglobulin light chain junction region [Macaca mulatta]MOW60675.1 immunoglobulin light chain junction region [Macaca mulatta]
DYYCSAWDTDLSDSLF